MRDRQTYRQRQIDRQRQTDRQTDRDKLDFNILSRERETCYKE